MNFIKLLALCLLVSLLFVVDVDAKKKKKKKKGSVKKIIDNDNFGTKLTTTTATPTTIKVDVEKEEEEEEEGDNNSVNKMVPPNIMALLQNVGDDVSSFVNQFKPPGIEAQGNVLKDITNGEENDIEFADPKNIGCTPKLEVQQIPVEVNCVFWPACVKVNRCGGCCKSLNEECKAIEMEEKETKVFRIPYDDQIARLHKIVVKHHTKCGCKCRVQPGDCLATQTFNPKNCQCECTKTQKNCGEKKVWSYQKCDCICKEKPETCSSWKKTWSEEQCACVCTKSNKVCMKKNKILDNNSCRCV